MIQFKRGKTEDWFKQLDKLDPLAAGQPGYDSTKNKLKIGDGEHSWAELPYTGGLNAEEILQSEAEARKRFKLVDSLAQNIGKLFGLNLSIFNKDKEAIITYGPESPDPDKTVGKLYLQQFESVPEADYVVASGVDKGWHYKKWRSGTAECWTTKTVTTAINTDLMPPSNNTEAAVATVPTYYSDSPIGGWDYPITFSEVPVENVTLQSKQEGVWLATATENSSTKTAKYKLAYLTQKSPASYKLSIMVKGEWQEN